MLSVLLHPFFATILPLATAFTFLKHLGFEAGIDKKWDEAKEFYFLYTGILILAGGYYIDSGAPLIFISLWSQVLNGMLLPVVLVCMIC